MSKRTRCVEPGCKRKRLRGGWSRPPAVMPQDKKYWYYFQPKICGPCADKLLKAIFGRQEE